MSERQRACLVFIENHAVLHLSSGHPGPTRSGFWAGGAIPGACRVLLLAVRTAGHQRRAVVEDRFEVTTLRAGRVRAVMIVFGVGD